ncbi:bifunctional 2-polyprenyl-6-hydroxyphenol methylase/3-demethylubiquinol 3-O-methyltransferase UbiG [Panacagrimonas sp.]|uniref:bifunctional 2-polyprenyl-6-hydroxyphenol methylase/3-demethylubiquinol 3-O-methyltransferase UbiG n=1 Tax=Panacagrimonas sp. TaxID=2480088 RepID=UPI003B51F543
MTNVDTSEIAHFDRLASTWWDPKGEMGPLHALNPPRVRFIDQACGGLKEKRALDVGCGGGILSEALAARGAQVTGIDLAEAALEVARHHAHIGGLSIDYRLSAAEALATEAPASFDLVCCLEMLEHVPDPASVVQACAQLVRPGGDVVFSTINRNPKSFALAIVGAEYVMGLIPRGTHEYAKFIRPSELAEWCRHAGLQTQLLRGLRYNPLLKSANLADDIDVNYLMHGRRPA